MGRREGEERMGGDEGGERRGRREGGRRVLFGEALTLPSRVVMSCSAFFSLYL